jgi:hypothetical protein
VVKAVNMNRVQKRQALQFFGRYRLQATAEQKEQLQEGLWFENIFALDVAKAVRQFLYVVENKKYIFMQRYVGEKK